MSPHEACVETTRRNAFEECAQIEEKDLPL
jgi:hypothetical protein